MQDCEHSVDVDIEQNVYGTYSFTSWGQEETLPDLLLGDCELRYIYLT